MLFHDWLAVHNGAGGGLLFWNTNRELDVTSVSFALVGTNLLSGGFRFWFADGDFVVVRLIFANDFVDGDVNLLLYDFWNPNFLSAGRRLWAAGRTAASVAALDEGLNLNCSIFPVTAVLADGSLLGGRNALRDFANALTLFSRGHHDGVLGRHVFPFRNADLVLLFSSLALLRPDGVFLGHFLGLLDQLAGSDFPSLSFRAAFRHPDLASLSTHFWNQNGSLDHARCWSAGGLRTALIGRRSANREDEESQGRDAGPQSFLHVALPLKQNGRLIE